MLFAVKATARWFILAPGVGLGAFLLVFFASTKRGHNLLERIVGIDLDNNGYIGEEPQPRTLTVEVEENGGQHVSFDRLPDLAGLPTFAKAVLNGQSTSMGRWTGRAGLFSRSEYEQLRDAMISYGYARWQNERAPAQGWTLTAKGRAILNRIANESGLDKRARENIPASTPSPTTPTTVFAYDTARTRVRAREDQGKMIQVERGIPAGTTRREGE